MEAAILGVLALMMTVMLYLDRSRRADTRDLRADTTSEFVTLRADMKTESATLRADMRTEITTLRKEMNDGFAVQRKEMKTEIATFRKEMNDGFAVLREEIRASSARTDARIDQLTTAVMNLAESLGQVKGRTEVLVTE